MCLLPISFSPRTPVFITIFIAASVSSANSLSTTTLPASRPPPPPPSAPPHRFLFARPPALRFTPRALYTSIGIERPSLTFAGGLASPALQPPFSSPHASMASTTSLQIPLRPPASLDLFAFALPRWRSSWRLQPRWGCLSSLLAPLFAFSPLPSSRDPKLNTTVLAACGPAAAHSLSRIVRRRPPPWTPRSAEPLRRLD